MPSTALGTFVLLGMNGWQGWSPITRAPGARPSCAGLTVELAEFIDEASATSIALTYCDMITGPAGEGITYEERLAGVEERYGAEHVVARSVRRARSEVERSTAFVESRLREVAAS